MKNRGVITQPNFFPIAAVQKTTKVIFKTSAPPKVNPVLPSHLMPARRHQKHCCFILYFHHEHITGIIYPEYTLNRPRA